VKTCSCHPFRILGAFILAGALLTAGAIPQSLMPSPAANIDAVDGTADHATMGNPAAVHCRDMGYEYEIVGDDGQRGICTLPDGEACDAWEFLQGKCGQAYSYCAQQGYRIRTVGDGRDPFSPEYAVCVTGEGAVIGPVTELSELGEKATGCGGDTTGGEVRATFEEGDEYVPPFDGAPPASFDWRNYLGSDWTTPVKDQGQCGSCWAFSAVGVSEAAHNIAENDPNLDKNLSEQYLVSDCSSSGTCCGGWKTSALAYIRDFGIPDESCMPYVDGGGCSCGGGTCDSNCAYSTGGSCSDRTCSDRCGDWSSRLVNIVSTGYVSTDPQTIKQALVDTGPLAVSMGIGSSYGGYWDGDIYRCSRDTGTNHAVAIVGYDDAGGYWWVRNSWGTGWEDNGYFKLGYVECRVEWYVYYAVAGPSDVGPLEYHSHTIDDDTNSNSDGNGDGIVDCGETIELYVDLINQGSDAATGINAAITTSDPYVSWPFNTSSSYPDITGSGTGTNSDDYDFAVDPTTPNGHIIQFDLDVTAGNGGPWPGSFGVPVSCTPNSPPEEPSSPSPPSGATAVPITADLAWTGGDPDPGDTVTYDVYLGTSNPPMTLLCNEISATTCDPGRLSSATHYYWYVVGTDNHGASASGSTWDLTTATGGGSLIYLPAVQRHP
jgi:putative hemolysin